ncbi:hypothetical protein PWT90_09690 [Aphanocladium album]|nr:hypothetical protein PWT90_09690 [Aphanocladium album]
MYAYIPALFLAATAAAVSSETRAVLHNTPVEKVCDPNQRLVCCGADNKCGEIKMNRHNKDTTLNNYDHCTAIIACCHFDVDFDHSDVWGDINNQCTYIGSLWQENGHNNGNNADANSNSS